MLSIKTPLSIDGSIGEGSGQVLRTSLTLSDYRNIFCTGKDSQPAAKTEADDAASEGGVSRCRGGAGDGGGRSPRVSALAILLSGTTEVDGATEKARVWTMRLQMERNF